MIFTKFRRKNREKRVEALFEKRVEQLIKKVLAIEYNKK